MRAPRILTRKGSQRDERSGAEPTRERSRRPRISLAGFRDPLRRPRYLVWTGVLVLLLVAVVVVALGVTSTRWFCAEGCHKVQDDTIRAYARSTHSRVSCMACHMPVNADPVTFLLHKAEALGELYLTVTNAYSLPLNPGSRLAFEMPAEQCTQCHNLKTRPPTPSDGVLIDHETHEREEITCTVCHNRVAHKEDFALTLKDPKTGKPNVKHEEFMSMTACFRCHEQTSTGRAPGACEACHTSDFELKPASHLEPGFYPKGHAEMARAEASRTAAFAASHGATAAAEKAAAEGAGREATPGRAEKGASHEPLELPPVASINVCSTCHTQTFCSDCHGLEMPHPAGFKKGHGELGKRRPRTCARCHGDVNAFCDECHHGRSMNIPYQASQGPWRLVHPNAVRALGATRCFECHKPTYCSYCHVRGIAR